MTLLRTEGDAPRAVDLLMSWQSEMWFLSRISVLSFPWQPSPPLPSGLPARCASDLWTGVYKGGALILVLQFKKVWPHVPLKGTHAFNYRRVEVVYRRLQTLCLSRL